MTRTGDAVDEIERAVARFMRTHHGLITLAQALLLGFTYAMVRTRLDSGEWRLVGPGVYCSASAPHTEHQRVLAAVWSPAVDGLASHRSAAWLWGLLSTAPDAPEITVADDKVVRLPGIVVHRSVDLAGLRPSQRAGIPVTDPFRTVIDLGAVARPFVVEDAVDRAIANRLVTLPGILGALETTGRQGVRGVGVLRRVLDRRGAQSRLIAPSVLESKMARILKQLPLPEPVVELVAGGENQYRLDFSWPDVRLTAEVEGYGPHAAIGVTVNDRRRANHLLGQGWARLEYGWGDVTRRRAEVGREIVKTYDRQLQVLRALGDRVGR